MIQINSCGLNFPILVRPEILKQIRLKRINVSHSENLASKIPALQITRLLFLYLLF